eukprot:3858057-Rhodomonas_salina.1
MAMQRNGPNRGHAGHSEPLPTTHHSPGPSGSCTGIRPGQQRLFDSDDLHSGCNAAVTCESSRRFYHSSSGCALLLHDPQATPACSFPVPEVLPLLTSPAEASCLSIVSVDTHNTPFWGLHHHHAVQHARKAHGGGRREFQTCGAPMGESWSGKQGGGSQKWTGRRDEAGRRGLRRGRWAG